MELKKLFILYKEKNSSNQERQLFFLDKAALPGMRRTFTIQVDGKVTLQTHRLDTGGGAVRVHWGVDSLCYFFGFGFWFSVFWVPPKAYRSSQVRDPTRATAVMPPATRELHGFT